MSILEAKHIEREHDPGRGLWERLDASRREVVELCGEKGVALFLFLLESSTTMPGQDNVAVCPLQRLRDVAAQLGASPDTVKRYVAVFRALSLVHHYHDHRREVKLHIPLGPYCSLTNFSTLDELIGKRKKQQQLALKVKIRYITRFGDPTLAHSDEIRTKFQELSTILEGEHLEPLKRQRLQMKIADLLSQLAGKAPSAREANEDLNDQQAVRARRESALLEREGDSDEELEASCPTTEAEQGKSPLQQGDLNRSKGDFISQGSLSSRQQTVTMRDSNHPEGDFTIIASEASAYQSEQQGDPKRQQGDPIPSSSIKITPATLSQEAEQGDLNGQQGDPILRQQAQCPLKPDEIGDSVPASQLEMGDSMPQIPSEVLAEVPYTYNVNYLINNIKGDNVIRKRLAQFLASILEKNEYENGYPTFSKYLKAFKYYSPEVIGRAFLATMVLLHRKGWRVEKPGATFTDQCRILSGQKPLAHYTLDDVEEWMRCWGHLSYPELIVAIAAPPPKQQVPEPASLRTGPHKAAPQPSPGHTGRSIPRRRTFGLQYTGRPVVMNKGVHNLSDPTRPPEKS